MKQLKRLEILFIGLFVCVFLSLVLASGLEIWRKKVRNVVLSTISSSRKNGIIELDSVRWCSLPISHHLDQGGVPFDIQDITHPSIVYIDSGWNGYSYWLAATPYPQSLPTSGEPYENTCIFYENENENKSPILFRPIDSNPIIFKGEAQYNSDPDIYFDSSSSRLYSITRKRHGPKYETRIVLQESQDGQIWSEPKIVIENSNDFLSPCLYKKGDKYIICGFQPDSTNKSETASIDIWESESLSDPDFTFSGSMEWNSDINIWHGDVFQWGNNYFLIACGTNENYKYFAGIKDVSKYLFLATSNDGFNFDFYETPLIKANGVYRASAFIKDDSLLVCYVSFHNRKFEKGSYISGNRIGLIEYPVSKLISEISDGTD